MFGPSSVDPDLEVIVVSRETIPGAIAGERFYIDICKKNLFPVNAARKANGLAQLQVFVIGDLEASTDEHTVIEFDECFEVSIIPAIPN